MPIYTLIDRACGVVPNKPPLSETASTEARNELLKTQNITADELTMLIESHRANIRLDDQQRPHGCSFPECGNAAVWEREFERTISGGTLLSMTISAASFSAGSPVRVLVFPGSSNFEHMKLGGSKRENRDLAHQYGCWEHIGGFIAFPMSSGKYSFDIVNAMLPESAPHPLWGVKNEVWEFLKTAERAQKMGFPEGSRALCTTCGLPYEHSSGFGLRPGEGDDFWKVFCDYCGAEVQISDADV